MKNRLDALSQRLGRLESAAGDPDGSPINNAPQVARALRDAHAWIQSGYRDEPPELPPPTEGTRRPRARAMIDVLDELLAVAVSEPLIEQGKNPRDLTVDDLTVAHFAAAEIVENAPSPTLMLPGDAVAEAEIEQAKQLLAHRAPDELPKAWAQLARAVAELRERTPAFYGDDDELPGDLVRFL